MISELLDIGARTSAIGSEGIAVQCVLHVALFANDGFPAVLSTVLPVVVAGKQIGLAGKGARSVQLGVQVRLILCAIPAVLLVEPAFIDVIAQKEKHTAIVNQLKVAGAQE